MSRKLVGRSLVVAACLLTLLGTACTPDDPAPSPSPTPSATPTETAQEREQRLAYEAAEKSYREFRAEVERVYARGGGRKPTTLMASTAGGPYLKSYQEVSEAYRALHHYSRGPLKIVYVRGDGFSTSELLLSTCEDTTEIVTYDEKGKKLYKGDVRRFQLTARLVSGNWKMWSGKGEQATSCA